MFIFRSAVEDSREWFLEAVGKAGNKQEERGKP
jgi:hypothetical protein